MGVICKIWNFSKNKVLLDTLDTALSSHSQIWSGGHWIRNGYTKPFQGWAAPSIDPLIPNPYKVCLFTLQKHRSTYKHRRGSISEERAADNQKYGTVREKSCQMQPLLSCGFWVSLRHSHAHFRGFPSCSSVSNTNTKFYWWIKSIHCMHFFRPWQYGIAGEGKKGNVQHIYL